MKKEDFTMPRGVRQNQDQGQKPEVIPDSNVQPVVRNEDGKTIVEPRKPGRPIELDQTPKRKWIEEIKMRNHQGRIITKKIECIETGRHTSRRLVAIEKV